MIVYVANVNRKAAWPARVWAHRGNAITSVWNIMIDDESETKMEWIEVEEQVGEGGRERAAEEQREKTAGKQ